MIPVLAAMVAGMAVGRFLRGRSRLFVVLDPLTAWIVRLLLFLLGAGIGADGELLAQVPALGAKGLAIAVASVAGSVAAARVLLGRYPFPAANQAVPSETPGASEGHSPAGGQDRGGESPVAASGEGERIGGNRPGNWAALRGSLAAVTAFGLGLPAGIFVPLASNLPFDPATPVLYALMFFVGIAAGADPTVFAAVREQGARMALLPLAVIAGTAAGSLAVALLLPGLPVRESLAVGAGFGYYSLSSLVIRELSGGDWAAVALLSNISREIITLLGAPMLAALGGPAAPAAAGGATSMDTTLAVSIQFSGRAWAVPALFSGVVLSLLVPFAVTFILGL